MTAISGSTAAQMFRPPPGGRERIDDRIEQGVTSGSISVTDATALGSALDAIDAGLSADGTGSTGSSARASRPDPAAMKEKIDGLIADQVSAGTLTSDQADTLKSLFSGGGDEARGPGGPGGPGGPPPSGATGGSETASDGTTSDVNAAASKLISDFLIQLQSSLGSGGGYGATGASSGSRTATSLVMDFDA
ncbi:hypothetical protein ASG52_17075 [Methylobacterium sp. Leaf456]|uniref:hypothetical protein n=1 Tax=Methylobacterium sp. Leaf456 TaxID=1736382 RepID=UPI0006F38EA0|nr:hypothetical protein [Methylobacterium sp. Leaf456]KQT60956.1 hypothetical protein ASG52_17075 [Methylobacterium sp. Leaf456]